MTLACVGVESLARMCMDCAVLKCPNPIVILYSTAFMLYNTHYTLAHRQAILQRERFRYDAYTKSQAANSTRAAISWFVTNSSISRWM